MKPQLKSNLQIPQDWPIKQHAGIELIGVIISAGIYIYLT
jgi:hypothetical protein